VANVGDITHILESVEHADPEVADELFPLVYAELRHLAAQKMAKHCTKVLNS
jgi:ECF sigma factor